ncbi:protein AGENET DOMAIN (AGD)-CONTAINING P1-like [Nicotiana tabacum]|uniref:Protein AGENET DOMAIN (AGD)-CONTAINING P1-like n=1 Tax=Nicotiana tabacum TaxID=4097 RepID=A0AC58S664_TOBAC
MAPITNLEKSDSRRVMLSNAIKAVAFKKQQAPKAPFEKGDEVEVASQEYGYIVVLTTQQLLFLLLALIITESKEIVTAGEIRSVPPQHPENNFRLYGIVDAFDNDGWWLGFITGKIGTKYVVYFPTTADEVAYPPEVLRFHQEWYNGNWVSSY